MAAGHFGPSALKRRADEVRQHYDRVSATRGDYVAKNPYYYEQIYRLLRFINSAYFALPRRVSSIHDAVVMLGARNVRSWVMLVALATLPDQPSELVRTALVRARMCELVGKATGAHDAASYFTVGLFSVVDALMGMRMEDVLEELPLAPELTEALLHR